ncbi:hypothetical protein [Streptomyces sp. NPDC003952]
MIAAGTTALWALESAAGANEAVRAAAGWTGPVVTPEPEVRDADGGRAAAGRTGPVVTQEPKVQDADRPLLAGPSPS